MNSEFVRAGDLMDTASYPEWAGDVIDACDRSRQQVVRHEFFFRMRDAGLGPESMRAFLVGIWPVIDQFPQYMAMNLLKVRYGRSRGQDMARKYLVRNIRVEQNHAEHWLEWASASGIARRDVIEVDVPPVMERLSQWCWNTCEREAITVGMAATNYAIEGATGEWAALVCSCDTYASGFDPSVRTKAMKWLKLHAQYDDEHPWEALDVICSIVGRHPATSQVAQLEAAVRGSYEHMRAVLDHCCTIGQPAQQGCPREARSTHEPRAA